jgi:hypothetical protein
MRPLLAAFKWTRDYRRKFDKTTIKTLFFTPFCRSPGSQIRFEKEVNAYPPHILFLVMLQISEMPDIYEWAKRT